MDAGIPLVDSTEDLINRLGFGRFAVQAVYDLIEKGLTESFDELKGYPRPDKTAVKQTVAAGLIARFMLLKGDNINAIKYAKIAQFSGSFASYAIIHIFNTLKTLSDYLELI
jgi:hypothetical protein